MRKYYSVPPFFFFIAAALGLFLRWQFIDPTPGVRYTYFLHAHSHVMFLGWVFNLLYLSFVEYHLAHLDLKPFKRFFLLLQLLVTAMLISFPIQGYGLYSITFTTVHTLAVIGFIIVFFRRTKGMRSTSLWFARISLIFFFISTAGPFALGYLMANDLGSTVWNNFSIYYYLHFQYNGFFLFGIFSLFFQVLERKNIAFSHSRAMTFGKWSAVACVPAYVLSVLFAKPGLAFNIAGGIAAAIQLLALGVFLEELKGMRATLKTKLTPTSYLLLRVSFAALLIKSVLQLLSADPTLAQLAWELRPVVIAYLHLVLLGVITFFLLAWYIEMEYATPSLARKAIWFLLFGFVTSEFCLVLLPWFNRLSEVAPLLIFLFSLLLLAGAFAFFVASLKNLTKISPSVDNTQDR